MDVCIEFDIYGKCGVDGINLLISIVNSSNLWRLFPYYITLNIVPATIENIKYFWIIACTIAL